MFALDAFSEISISGNPITFSSVAPTAVSASGSVNSFASKTTAPPATAVTGTGSVTAMGALVSDQQSGQVATGNLGVLTPQISITPSAKTGTGSLGSVLFAYSATLTGLTGTVTPGSLVPTHLPSISAVTGTGTLGSFDHVFYWTQVNDTQSPGWTPVNTQ